MQTIFLRSTTCLHRPSEYERLFARQCAVADRNLPPGVSAGRSDAKRVLQAARRSAQEAGFFNRAATQAALVHGNGFAVLAFRGTLGLRGWLADFDFPPVDWEGEGKVHKGFKGQLDVVWEEVPTELNSMDVAVFYTGHSLGAALATLAAARRFLEGGTPPAALYSFGSPRVGTMGFNAFPSGFLHCRVVNDRDIVPTVPPRRLGLRVFRPDFHHVGIPHHTEHDGHLRRGNLNDDDGVAGPFTEMFRGLAFWRDGLAEILRTKGASLTEKFSDPAAVNYTARIEKAGDVP